MSNEWKCDTFTPTQIKDNMDNRVFTIPKYQRGIVWKDSQRADLVDTIKKGLPFGALLLYKDSSNTYQIIDGLQRSTAIVDFSKNPAQFFNDEDIDDSVILDIARTIPNVQPATITEKIRSLLIEWVKTHQTLDDVIRMQFSDFGEYVRAHINCPMSDVEIGRQIKPMLEKFQNTCSTINNIKIPAIVIEGDPDLLPVLFERINSKGTQLSKYQIYAASWNTDSYRISDNNLNKIVKANRDRYDSMLDGKTSIDDYDPVAFLNNKVLDAYEIAFGFGKKLCEDFPHLFGATKEQTQVDSIGFTLLNICLGLKNKDAHRMNVKLKQLVGDTNINNFLNTIIECVKYVDACIGKYNKFKSNSRSDSGKKPLHTEFQICAIIASVFLMKYTDITLDPNENIVDFKLHLGTINPMWRQQQKDSFKRNAPKIYIMEILQGKWAGSGDKKMDQVLITPDYYTRNTTSQDFERILDIWFNNLNKDRSEMGKVATAKEPELLMLALVYLMNRFSAVQQLDDSKFDIEHLATKQLMKEKLGNTYRGQLRLPISSFGNLCLLPEYENRSKGKKTIYQDTDYLSKTHKDISYIEEYYSFTTRNDLNWLDDNSLSADEFKDAYYKFIEKRYGAMKRIILNQFDNI